MEPMTVSNFVSFTDPALLDLAYRGRDILRVCEPLFFHRLGAIAKMTNQSKRYTRKLLKEMVEANLIVTDEDSEPDGAVLYGTLLTTEDVPLNVETKPFRTRTFA